jgi:hypothetical protein
MCLISCDRPHLSYSDGPGTCCPFFLLWRLRTLPVEMQLAGFIPPSAGRLLYEGVDLKTDNIIEGKEDASAFADLLPHLVQFICNL